jgi:ethanolamine ammonia-lyase large subunit
VGHGKEPWDLQPELKERIWRLYDDAKISLWTEYTDEFIETIPNAVVIATQSKDREDYVAHPPTGEVLSAAAIASLEKLRDSWAGRYPDVQIVISDGLNTNAIMDEGHLAPYLTNVRKELSAAGYTVSDTSIVVKSGRVRAGYAIGDVLFEKAAADKPKAVLHVIGERPGSGHHNFSVYIAAPKAKVWAQKGVDHDIVRVISGISDTAYNPVDAASETVKIVNEMTRG